MTREELKPMIVKALEAHNGRAAIYKVSEFIWEKYSSKILDDKRMLYTWQYEMRWAAMALQKDGLIELGKFKKGVWSLIPTPKNKC